MNEELIWVSMTVLGFLLGAIPFGIVISKALGQPDPRTAGSKNIGFTNVLRVSGKKAGILTLLGDLGKGWVIAWAAMHWLTVESYIMVVALAPILGHLFSPFLGFKGGKGVATAVGVLLGLNPWMGLLAVAIWIMVAAIWRMSSLAALAAAGLAPIYALFFLGLESGTFVVLVMSLLIIWRHKSNIASLIAGKETRIGKRSTP